jgi:cytochrome b561
VADRAYRRHASALGRSPSGQLPGVSDLHGAWLSTLLVGFIVLHVFAALYHQFVRKGGLFERMFFGRRVSIPSTSAE